MFLKIIAAKMSLLKILTIFFLDNLSIKFILVMCSHCIFLQRRKEEKERDNRYTAVMRSLVWRYVSAMHRKFEESPVTEDDINEVKGEITAMRYELIEIFEKNGMDISSVDRKEKSKYLLLKSFLWPFDHFIYLLFFTP